MFSIYLILLVLAVAILSFIIGYYWSKSKPLLVSMPEAPNTTINQPANGKATKLAPNMTDWFPDGLIFFDQNLCLVWANETAEQWFAISRSKNKGQPINELIKSIDFNFYIKQKNNNKAFEFNSPENNKIVLRNQIFAYHEQQFLLHSRDITQIKKLETVRQDFVANASHQLKTPITIIDSYLQMMMQSTDKNSQWHSTTIQMCEQIDRIKKVISGLLMLAQMEDVESQQPHQFIKLRALLENAINNAAVLSNDKQQTIELDVKSEFDLLCNRDEMTILVDNLLSNAIYYTPNKGHIRLQLNIDLAGGSLSVIDNGIGIDQADMGRITERFYRVGDARARQPNGSGLGLAIVNHIVSRHQAELLIDSKLKKGSVFTVTFPIDRVRKNKDTVDLLFN